VIVLPDTGTVAGKISWAPDSDAVPTPLPEPHVPLVTVQLALSERFVLADPFHVQTSNGAAWAGAERPTTTSSATTGGTKNLRARRRNL
jgi:hypothetical protein